MLAVRLKTALDDSFSSTSITAAALTLFGPTSIPRFLRLLWFGFLTLLGGIWAYYRAFTGFSFYDDEGSMMAAVKQYLDGLKLYDQFWSGYGPVYYFYNWLLRSNTGTPVTHDVVRISSLQQAREYQWLTRSTVNYCDILIGLQNLPSLNFWAGMNPPGRLNIDAWILVLCDKEQLDIELALSKHPNACAIYNPEILAFWSHNRRDIGGLPLVRYIHDEFKPVGSMDNFVFLVRNGRDLSKIPNL